MFPRLWISSSCLESVWFSSSLSIPLDSTCLVAAVVPLCGVCQIYINFPDTGLVLPPREPRVSASRIPCEVELRADIDVLAQRGHGRDTVFHCAAMTRGRSVGLSAHDRRPGSLFADKLRFEPGRGWSMGHDIPRI